MKASTQCAQTVSLSLRFGWKTPTQKDADLLNSFINDVLVIELDRPIKLKTADIRKLHKIKLPDAIIAATAAVNNYTSLTHNVGDF